MAELEITVDGQLGEIDFAAVLTILRSSSALLEMLDHARKKSQWTVSGFSEGSLRVVLKPRASPDGTVAEAGRPGLDLVAGLEALSSAPTVPEAFTMDALKGVHAIGRRLGTGGVEGLRYAWLNGTRREAPLDPTVTAHAEQAQRPAVTAIGSAEGVLDVLNIRGRSKRKRGSLFDPRTRRVVRCTFDVSLLEDLAPFLGKRIRAMGMVKYNSRGQAVLVMMDRFEPLREKDTFRFSDLVGAAPDWTGGLAPEEFVRRQRRG